MTGAGYAVEYVSDGPQHSSQGSLKMDHHGETNSFFVKLVMDYLSTDLKVKQLNYYITISLCDTPPPKNEH